MPLSLFITLWHDPRIIFFDLIQILLYFLTQLLYYLYLYFAVFRFSVFYNNSIQFVFIIFILHINNFLLIIIFIKSIFLILNLYDSAYFLMFLIHFLELQFNYYCEIIILADHLNDVLKIDLKEKQFLFLFNRLFHW